MAMNEKALSLNQFLDQEEESENEQFVVDTDEKANWVLRKIAQKEQEGKDAAEVADQEINKVKEWLKTEQAKVDRDIDFFKGKLIEYAMAKKADDPKFKTKKLPNGSFGFRKQQPQWEVNDEKAVEALQKAGLNDLIQTKKTAKKADMKKQLSISGGQVVDPESGEIIEGIKVMERDDKFGVKIK